MSRLTQLDILVVDELFEGEPGYVLDFSNRTFSAFFGRELSVDIDDPRYAVSGSSKAKRLRTFLMTTDDATAARTLTALWQYREGVRQHFNRAESVPQAEIKLQKLLAKVGAASPSSELSPNPSIKRVNTGALRQSLLDLAQLAPHPRGYAFEKFLAEFFEVCEMKPREPFRIRGEQIDGSFELGSETYLLEAKWQNGLTDAADLRAFNGKVEEKAAWSRGLFVSYAGYSTDGLYAFGRGKRVICMDGRDLHDVLYRDLNLAEAIARKVRRAAETGSPFVSVTDLFP